MSSGRSSQRGRLLLRGAHEVLDVVEVDARQVGAPGRHRLACRTAAAPLSRSLSIHSGSFFLRARCRGRRPRTGRGGRWRRRRRSRPSRTRSGRGPRARLGRAVGGHAGCLPCGRSAVAGGADGARRAGGRDVGGADVVAVGQRRQALHVHAEQPGERLGLGLAQLRGTPAATCCTGQWPWHSCTPRPRGAAADRGGVAVGASGRRPGPRARCSASSPAASTPARTGLELADPLLGEALDRLRAGGRRR